jgi:hypothetical protein
MKCLDCFKEEGPDVQINHVYNMAWGQCDVCRAAERLTGPPLAGRSPSLHRKIAELGAEWEGWKK